MRVLIFADHWSDLGGGEVVAAQLAQQLRGAFQLGVLTTDRTREGIEERGDLTIYRLRSSYPARLRPVVSVANPPLLRQVGAVLDRFRPDVIHAWNVHQHLSYASLLMASARGIPTVMTFQDALSFCHTKFHCYIERGAPCPPRPSYRASPRSCPSCWRSYWLFPPRSMAIQRLLDKALTRRVSVSRALADALADNGLGQATVIHNGLPDEDLSANSGLVRQISERFGLGSEAILSGGRMGFFKGQQQVLEAFASLSVRRPESQLVFAGRDDDWFVAGLKRRVGELGLERRVVFTGHLPRQEFLALMRASAAFASLSLYLDPFPTVNLEAAACGVPVVGTCFGGTPEVVLDGETGLIVNPYQIEEVAQALEVLLGDPTVRSRYGTSAHARVREQFRLERMGEAYATLFLSLTRA